MSYEYFRIYTENYLKTIQENLIPDTAAVVIIRNDKALILQRGLTAPWMPGKWNLPGGGIDKKETPEIAAKREALEETSIDLANNNLIRVSINDGGGWVLETFVTKIRNNNKLPETIKSKKERGSLLPISQELGFPESIDYKWISIDELDKYEFVPTVKENIRKALGK